MSEVIKKENYKSSEPCAVCGERRPNMVCYHHIKTRGSGGSDHDSNLIPVCLKHHNEFHAYGNSKMLDKYLSAKLWFLRNGWEYCETSRKWINSK